MAASREPDVLRSNRDMLDDIESWIACASTKPDDASSVVQFESVSTQTVQLSVDLNVRREYGVKLSNLVVRQEYRNDDSESLVLRTIVEAALDRREFAFVRISGVREVRRRALIELRFPEFEFVGEDAYYVLPPFDMRTR